MVGSNVKFEVRELLMIENYKVWEMVGNKMKYGVRELLMTMDKVMTGTLKGGGEGKNGKGGIWSGVLWDTWHQEKGYHV